MIERLPISLKADYALKAIFDLTLQPPGVPIKIAGIAKRQKIPQKFLELILAGLKQGGFVESRRGAEGGYLLGRPAESLTVGEVVRFVEGSRAGRPRGRRNPDNPFSAMWRKVDEGYSAIIDRTTFAELTRSWQEQQSKYLPNWEI